NTRRPNSAASWSASSKSGPASSRKRTSRRSDVLWLRVIDRLEAIRAGRCEVERRCISWISIAINLKSLRGKQHLSAYFLEVLDWHSYPVVGVDHIARHPSRRRLCCNPAESKFSYSINTHTSMQDACLIRTVQYPARGIDRCGYCVPLCVGLGLRIGGE